MIEQTLNVEHLQPIDNLPLIDSSTDTFRLIKTPYVQPDVIAGVGATMYTTPTFDESSFMSMIDQNTVISSLCSKSILLNKSQQQQQSPLGLSVSTNLDTTTISGSQLTNNINNQSTITVTAPITSDVTVTATSNTLA